MTKDEFLAQWQGVIATALGDMGAARFTNDLNRLMFEVDADHHSIGPLCYDP